MLFFPVLINRSFFQSRDAPIRRRNPAAFGIGFAHVPVAARLFAENGNVEAELGAGVKTRFGKIFAKHGGREEKLELVRPIFIQHAGGRGLRRAFVIVVARPVNLEIAAGPIGSFGEADVAAIVERGPIGRAIGGFGPDEHLSRVAGIPILLQRMQPVGGDDGGQINPLGGPAGPGVGGRLIRLDAMSGFDGEHICGFVPVIEIAIDGGGLVERVNGNLRSGGRARDDRSNGLRGRWRWGGWLVDFGAARLGWSKEPDLAALAVTITPSGAKQQPSALGWTK